MPILSVNRFFGMGKEATRGTAVTPSIWLPIESNPTLTPTLTWLPDKSLRGSAVVQYDDVPSVRHDEFEFKGNVYADTFPALMLASLGGPDVVTGTVAPYTHKIGLANAATTGSQPPSYTGIDTDNILESTAQAKQFTAGQLGDLSLDFAATGALTYSTKYFSNPFTEVAAPSNPTWSTAVLLPAWSGSITIGTVVSGVVVSGSLDIKRSTEAIPVIGQQAPYRLFAGPVDVSGKLVFIAEANDPTFENALTRYQQNLTIQFTDPVSSDTVTFQMSNVQLKNPKVSGSKAYEEITCDFQCNADATDAQNGGYSPILFTATNSQSAAY